MFNMGIGEILVVLAVALVFVGPAKIPEIARTVGRGLGRLRRASDEVRDTIQSEIDTLDREEIKNKIAEDKTADAPAGPYADADPYTKDTGGEPAASAPATAPAPEPEPAPASAPATAPATATAPAPEPLPAPAPVAATAATTADKKTP